MKQDALCADLLDHIEDLHEVAPFGVWRWTIATGAISWSPELFDILGRDPAAYTPTLDSMLAAIHPDDRAAAILCLLETVQTGRPRKAELRILGADGGERIFSVKLRLVVERDAVTGVKALCLDLTHLRETEVAARRSEAEYRDIIQLTPQMLWVADARGSLLNVSNRFSEVTGLPEERALGQGWMEVVHPDDLPIATQMLEQAGTDADMLDFRYRIRCADGGYRWVRTRAFAKRDEHGAVSRWTGLSEDINEQVEAERRLAESEEHFRHTVELSPQIPWTADPDGRVREVAPQWLALLGTTRQETLGGGWMSFLHPDDVEPTAKLWARSLASGDPLDCKYRLQLHNCGYRWLRARARPRRDADGKIIRWYGVLEDIQEQVEAEAALLKAEERYRLATQATKDLIWDHDLVTHGIEWNQADEDRLGYSFEALGRHASWWISNIHPDDRLRIMDELGQAIDGNATHFASEYRFARPDGSYATVYDRGFIIRNADGEPVRAVGAMQDLSDRKAAEERVLWTATHDSLTGVLNRSMFNDRLAAALAAATLNGERLALLQLDVDHFKQINDSLGHDAGDELLKMFAERLRGAVRSTDTIARIGGDEFAVIMPGVGKTQDVDLRAEAILERMREPFTYAGSILDCRASIGASIFPQHGHSPEELLKSADIALYSAKAAGRGGLLVFQSPMRSEMQKRSSMVSLARDALREDRIVPFYQPKIDYRTDTVIGFEALLRWRHPSRGIQAPRTIEAAFEDLELAAALSDRMIEMVIGDMRRWLDDGVPFGHIAVNASAAEFRQNVFAERVLESLARAQVPTSHLQLEVTETVFLGRGSEYVDRALKLLSAEGVTVALDDFGTGYASLRHLRQYPVDVIKIDQSFVRGMETSADDEAIIRAVINLGRSLDIQVVAEGIETLSQDRDLRRLGCDAGQGYLYSKAVPAARLPALLQQLAQRADARPDHEAA